MYCLAQESKQNFTSAYSYLAINYSVSSLEVTRRLHIILSMNSFLIKYLCIHYKSVFISTHSKKEEVRHSTVRFLDLLRDYCDDYESVCYIYVICQRWSFINFIGIDSVLLEIVNKNKKTYSSFLFSRIVQGIVDSLNIILIVQTNFNNRKSTIMKIKQFLIADVNMKTNKEIIH